MTTAASVDIRVRVERFENVIATVFPYRADRSSGRLVPLLSAVLCEEAFRMSATSSVGPKSEMERKWRGAKGEVSGVLGVAAE